MVFAFAFGRSARFSCGALGDAGLPRSQDGVREEPPEGKSGAECDLRRKLLRWERLGAGGRNWGKEGALSPGGWSVCAELRGSVASHQLLVDTK